MMKSLTRAIVVSLLLLLHSDLFSQYKPRVAVFFETGFPVVEGFSLSRQQLQSALAGFQVVFMTTDELERNLKKENFDVFVMPFGSAFPKQAWSPILNFLREGGSWVNLGGTPFSIPVVKDGKVWRQEIRQVSYHKKLGITQSFPVSTKSVAKYSANAEVEEAAGLLGEFKSEEEFEYYFRFTSTKDFPNEDGTAGQRDAVLKTLVWGVREDGLRLTAPFLQIDRLQGEFAGGRWLLANFQGSIKPKALRFLVESAIVGSMDFRVRPLYACYREGEIPSLSVQLSWPDANKHHDVRGNCEIEILTEKGAPIEKLAVPLIGQKGLAIAERTLAARNKLAPGFYVVRAYQRIETAPAGTARRLLATTGFWIYDSELMKDGKPFTTDGAYLIRDGIPYPVTGTTYMASDVARKFLLEPNPYLWNKDFAEMKEAGINMIRTGIWTGWKNYMLDVGAPNESALRSLDAFILTARKHNIPLIFTFFAFLPETWGGVNAYLDPRSIQAQKKFIQLISQRYGEVNDLAWDLINEPSFCNPQHLWNCRPNYDEFEREAWDRWITQRYPSASNEDRKVRLQEQWRLTEGESFGLPPLEEFQDVNIFDTRHPLRVLDYRLFAQEMFRGWVKEMAGAIRSNGNPRQLITVGQDEGGTYDSPSNQFFGDVVGFTSLHNWWLNDDLVWDNVVTRVGGVPNLVEETGVMFYERPDGGSWRSEEESAALLERKLAISIGAGGAGFLEWIWNINPFMKSDNEATIGLLRADGTIKPEYDALARFAEFFASNAHLMTSKQKEEVLIVIPHSNMFSSRNSATEATKQCVRVMSYHLGVNVTAVSEYKLGTIHDPPRLVAIPSPMILTDDCWRQTLEIARKGSTVLITGPLDADEHWLPKGRLKQLGLDITTVPVSQEEKALIDGREVAISFRNLKSQRIQKSLTNGQKVRPLEIQMDKGRILWFPLPVENADNIEPIVGLYRFALDQAKVSPMYSVGKPNPGILILSTAFESSILYTCVSEASEDENLDIKDAESGKVFNVTVPAQRTSLFFVSRKDGSIISKLQ